MANSVDLDQTAPGAVCSGSTLFASILNSPVMLGNYLQQTTLADVIFRCIFFLGALRFNIGLAFILFQACYSACQDLFQSVETSVSHILRNPSCVVGTIYSVWILHLPTF